MTVRRHVPLGLKVGGAGAALVAALAAGVVASRLWPVHAPVVDLQPTVVRLSDENRALRIERDRFSELANTVDSRGLMAQSTIRELGAQVAGLQNENTRLKEDVAFFEAATADRPPGGASDATSGIAIRRFQVTRESGGRVFRYRLLLTQDAKATLAFSGVLQVVVTVLQDGRTTTRTFPEAASTGDGVNVSPSAVVFKSYKRIDGSFEVPATAVVRTVQARILERGVVRVQQSTTVN